MGISVGLVGGRGYVGQEIIRNLVQHPEMELTCVASSSLAGRPLAEEFPQWSDLNLHFQSASADALSAQAVDVWILALGNGEARPLAERLASPTAKLLDVSADFRGDSQWQYGLSEVYGESIAASRKISNPGCYATGVQLALWPVKDFLVDVPWAFGVSGYSGAGRTPSPRNDPLALGDNLMPYHLIDHSHEVEIERHLGHHVRLLPHVAEFFRGISLTISFELSQPRTEEELHDAYRKFFDPHPLLVYDAAIPEIRHVRETPLCRVGGLQRDPRNERRWIIVSVLDNLSKGAATQAIQNINLMFGFDSSLGLMRD